jgi:cobalt-zinc-cadmium efflux system membrane fusion protein
MNRQSLIVTCILLAGAAAVWIILSSEPATEGAHAHEHEEHGHADEEGTYEEAERGPNGGRLLRDGNFSAELLIDETGGTPEFRLYAYRDGKAVPPADVQADVGLTRLGGRVERFRFEPRDHYLQGVGVVGEPHSFDVRLTMRANGAVHEWSYPSYEARVEISEDAAAGAGIRVAQAGPAQIRETLLLYGSIIADPGRLRRVSARFPGVVREVHRNLGERVSRGDTLALIESNESLQTYPVRAPISGVILSRSVNPGENVGEQPLFTIADLSIVQAELAVFRRDLAKVRLGQSVRVRADDGSTESSGRIGFISPVGSGENQAVRVRVELDNRDGLWHPGIFVTGEIEVMTKEVPVAVARDALQTWRDMDVVFANFGNLYEPRVIDLGSMDRLHAEVRSGIDPGEPYVAGGSFIIKAEIGKAGAGHDH